MALGNKEITISCTANFALVEVAPQSYNLNNNNFKSAAEKKSSQTYQKHANKDVMMLTLIINIHFIIPYCALKFADKTFVAT